MKWKPELYRRPKRGSVRILVKAPYSFSVNGQFLTMPCFGSPRGEGLLALAYVVNNQGFLSKSDATLLADDSCIHENNGEDSSKECFAQLREWKHEA